MTTLGGLAIKNTRNAINADTRLCALCYAPPKRGKTTLGATLDKMTKRFRNKPTLVIAVEAADGGGTSSIQEWGVDFVQPESYQQLTALAAALATDTKYGGVVLDNATDLVKRVIQPYSMTFPSREKIATRGAGVPERSDYQTMGEVLRNVCNNFINLTKHPNPAIRKDFLMLALEREKSDGESITAIQPDLPGAMSQTASAMFELVCTLAVRRVVKPDPENPKRPIVEMKRVLCTASDGVRVLGDRYKIFPEECEPNFEALYEKYWVPRIERAQAEEAANGQQQ